MTDPRPIRPCKGCTVEDDHPRHVIGFASAGGPAGKPETWHLDCHAHAGCPSCIERLAGAGDRHGAELTEYFASLRGQDNG